MKQEIVKGFPSNLGAFALNFLYAVVIIVVAFRISSMLPGWLKKSKLYSRLDASVRGFLMSMLTIVLRVVALVAAALIIGVPGSALITLFGSAGLAIGLALQGSLSNLAGGLMLLFFRPFSVGDYIRTGENEGTVDSITAFYTTILTRDKKRVILPNGALTNDTLINYSAERMRMLEIDINVAYDSDIDAVRKILLHQARACSLVLSHPEPIAPLTEHGSSALVFSLRCCVLCDNYLTAKYILLEGIKRDFDAAGIVIPFPQMDIHTKD